MSDRETGAETGVQNPGDEFAREPRGSDMEQCEGRMEGIIEVEERREETEQQQRAGRIHAGIRDAVNRGVTHA